jgi:hypothetical protein
MLLLHKYDNWPDLFNCTVLNSTLVEMDNVMKAFSTTILDIQILYPALQNSFELPKVEISS